MSKSVEKSLNVFTSELKKRIDLFSSSIVSSNVESNRDSFNELIKIMANYTDTPVEKLSLSELYQVELDDIKRILELIGTDINLIDELVEKIETDGNDLGVYEVIRTNVTLYAKNFLSINETQNEVITSNIQVYQRYIDLIEQQDFEKLFEDINDLMHIMTTLGLGEEDKWPILVYVAQKNNQTVRAKADVNIVSKCCEIINKYTSEEPTDFQNRIMRHISNNELVDMDLIPSIAERIAYEENYNKYDVQNCLVGLVLNTLIDEYAKEDSREDVLTDIKDALSFVIPVTDEIILTAREVLEESREFMSNCIDSGNVDYDYYQNTTITELEEKYNSREIAIDLKKLPILKTISETLDHIESCAVDSEEYNLCCSTLVELIDAYNLVNEKKKEL